MRDNFINQFDPPKPPRPEFTAALYQRITQPMKTTSRNRVLRAVALSFAMVAVIATVLYFSPSARAFADSIIRQFGGYVFVQATPQPDPAKRSGENEGNFAGKPPAVSPQEIATAQAQAEEIATLQAGKAQNENDSMASDIVEPANDAAAASQLAGFTVLAPSYLPAGYTADNQPGAWTVSHDNNSVTAGIKYEDPATHGSLVIEEQMYRQPDEPNTVDRSEIQDVTVHGRPGAWIPDNGGKNTLVWDENGITYILVTNALPKDEVLKVAESLGK